MSIFSDKQVRSLVSDGKIIIDPYFDVFQGPNCYHCHFGGKIKRINFKYIKEEIVFNPLDKLPQDFYEELEIDDYVMKPGEFILGESFEYFGTNGEHVIRLLNSSSLARVGISQAALGMINAGCGMKQPVKLTLELINNSPLPMKLVATKTDNNGVVSWGTEVLKIAIEGMDSKPENLYDEWKYGVYSVDDKVAGTKMADRFKDKDLVIPTNSLHRKGLNNG